MKATHGAAARRRARVRCPPDADHAVRRLPARAGHPRPRRARRTPRLRPGVAVRLARALPRRVDDPGPLRRAHRHDRARARGAGAEPPPPDGHGRRRRHPRRPGPRPGGGGAGRRLHRPARARAAGDALGRRARLRRGAARPAARGGGDVGGPADPHDPPRGVRGGPTRSRSRSWWAPTAPRHGRRPRAGRRHVLRRPSEPRGGGRLARAAAVRHGARRGRGARRAPGRRGRGPGDGGGAPRPVRARRGGRGRRPARRARAGVPRSRSSRPSGATWRPTRDTSSSSATATAPRWPPGRRR